MPVKKKATKKATSKKYKLNRIIPKDGNQGKKGEPPGQRRTAARRAKVARMNAEKRSDELSKNIKNQQRKKPY